PTREQSFSAAGTDCLVFSRSAWRSEFLHLFALFFGENLFELVAGFLVEVSHLFELLVTQIELIVHVRRQKVRRTTGSRKSRPRTAFKFIGTATTGTRTAGGRSEFAAVTACIRSAAFGTARGVRRADLVTAEFPVVVLVERLEGLAGAGDFLGRNRPVAIGVEG